MSTILDALKKSEQERKLNNIPTLSDMPAPQEKSSWPIIVIIALLSVLLLLVIWIIASGRAVEPVNSESQAVTNSEADIAETPRVPADANQAQVQVVSFSDQPAQRFTMINDKLYREGDFIRAGLKVEEIKANSVILNQRGRRIERRP